MSDHRDREFIDTNVLVYAHDQSAGNKHARSRDLVNHLWETRTGCLSIQILQEFYVTVTRKVAQPIKPGVAKEIIRDLSYWQVYSPSVADILGAIDLQCQYKTSFWDAMVIFSAKTLGCKVIWSEDLNDGQVYDGVVIKNPFTR